jgi:hypothetical protein
LNWLGAKSSHFGKSLLFNEFSSLELYLYFDLKLSALPIDQQLGFCSSEKFTCTSSLHRDETKDLIRLVQFYQVLELTYAISIHLIATPGTHV